MLIPLQDSLTGTIRGPLLLLLATVGMVLLIACVNVANLLIARGAARRAELVMRVALGATRTRIVRQLVTESLMLAGGGGILGLAVSWWVARAVVGLAPADVPRLDAVGISWPVFGYTAVICAATGLLFGLTPAWSAARASVGQTGAGRRATAGGGRLRAALMIVEIAVALVLVTGAGLLLRSFHRITQQPVGFDTAGLVTANITFSAQRYFDVAARTRVYEAFEESVGAVPGVRGVALTTDLPIGGSPIFHNLAFDGRTMTPGTEPEVYYRGVNAAYFDVLGIAIRAGRRFTALDRAGAPAVAIVNEAFVREYYPAENPLGRRIRWASGNGEWITIVGICADVRGLSLDQREVPAVHVPYPQERLSWRTFMDVAVMTDGNAAPVAAAMRRALSHIDRTVPLTKVGTMEQVLAKSVEDRRFNLYLLGAFGFVALLLAAVGTYGVMSQAVDQRRHELGVRLALGARPGDMFRLVVGRGMGIAAAGVAAGLAASAMASGVLSGFLFETPARDLTTFAAAAAVLLAAAAVATSIPARRAARVDPLVVLRSE
jgi:putative ABC transport system permease protein